MTISGFMGSFLHDNGAFVKPLERAAPSGRPVRRIIGGGREGDDTLPTLG